MKKQNSLTFIEKKIIYFKHKSKLNMKHIDKRKNIIDKYSKIYNIDWRELYGILLLEYINRGSGITRHIERFVVFLFTQSAIKHDLSLGIAQVKVSTAKTFYPESESKVLARKLLIDDFNIHLCAQIIKRYYIYPNKKNMLLGLVKEYTTGNKDAIENSSIVIYYTLLRWLIEEQSSTIN